VEFYLTLITSGQLTPRLFALKHGDRVFLGPKASGVFTLDKVAPENFKSVSVQNPCRQQSFFAGCVKGGRL